MDTTIAANSAPLESHSERTVPPNEAHNGNPPVASLVSQQLASNPSFDLTRWELQARILADQPADEIARQMGLPLSMVSTFEADEFNVRPLLQHSSVVLHKIIAIPPNEEWSEADVGKFWMWLAHTYGAAALNVAIRPFINLPPKLQELGLRAYLSPVCDVPEEFRILVAGKLTPIAATVTVPGRKLIGKLQKTTERRVRPVDLLTSLSGLICSPPEHEAVRDEEPQPAPFYLKEAA